MMRSPQLLPALVRPFMAGPLVIRALPVLFLGGHREPDLWLRHSISESPVSLIQAGESFAFRFVQ